MMQEGRPAVEEERGAVTCGEIGRRYAFAVQSAGAIAEDTEKRGAGDVRYARSAAAGLRDCSRPKSGARDPINQSLKPTFNQVEPRSLHPPDLQPGQVRPGSKSRSIIFRSETEQVSVTADRRAYAG